MASLGIGRFNAPGQDPERDDRIGGGLLGLALGDAFGAPHEGGPLERLLWRAIGSRGGQRRWTDDTQMTIDLVESLIANHVIDQDDLAYRFAASYRWSRGYGPGTARILKRVRRGEPWHLAAKRIYKTGSFGNGGAMRAPAIGLFFGHQELVRTAQAARCAAEITHAHPLAQEGAILIALAAALALDDHPPAVRLERLLEWAESPEFADRLSLAATWLDARRDVSASDVARTLGNGMAAAQSCVTAIYVALRFEGGQFEDLLQFTIGIGGDVDTIAAMAGGIWGAKHGLEKLPRSMLLAIEEADYLRDLARRLAACVDARGW